MKRIDMLTNNQRKVVEVLCKLTDRERFILQLRYGSRRTIRDISEYLGVSFERIRQIENNALNKINKIFE